MEGNAVGRILLIKSLKNELDSQRELIVELVAQSGENQRELTALLLMIGSKELSIPSEFADSLIEVVETAIIKLEAPFRSYLLLVPCSYAAMFCKFQTRFIFQHYLLKLHL